MLHLAAGERIYIDTGDAVDIDWTLSYFDTNASTTFDRNGRQGTISTATSTDASGSASIGFTRVVGGIGVIHRNLEPEIQAEHVRQVKKFESGMVVNPLTIYPDEPLSEALDSEAARMIRTGETEDHKEAARAFVEKRKPEFQGD
mgnify:CR=1 FL=1